MNKLIEILRDRGASISDRDDAAMDLADQDDALDALIGVAADSSENATVLATCGASIAEIWRRLGMYDKAILDRLTAEARNEVEAAFR